MKAKIFLRGLAVFIADIFFDIYNSRTVFRSYLLTREIFILPQLDSLSIIIRPISGGFVVQGNVLSKSGLTKSLTKNLVHCIHITNFHYTYNLHYDIIIDAKKFTHISKIHENLILLN